MQVHDNIEEELKQLEYVLDVLSDIHLSNHFAQTGHSDELQKREKLKLGLRLARDQLCECVDRHCGNEVNEKATPKVGNCAGLVLEHFVTCLHVSIGRSEGHQDIQEKEDVRDAVACLDKATLDEFRVESNFKGYLEAVVEGHEQDQEVPLRLKRMVHGHHQMRAFVRRIFLLLNIVVAAVGRGYNPQHVLLGFVRHVIVPLSHQFL